MLYVLQLMKSKRKNETLIQLPYEIENLCKVLEGTDLNFGTGRLKVHDQNKYCAAGVLGKNAGIDDHTLNDEAVFYDIGSGLAIDVEPIRKKLLNFYGIDLLKEYPKDLICPLCKALGDDVTESTSRRLENVLAHLNDDHNDKKKHYENARLIREYSKTYNLVTGERIE